MAVTFAPTCSNLNVAAASEELTPSNMHAAAVAKPIILYFFNIVFMCFSFYFFWISLQTQQGKMVQPMVGGNELAVLRAEAPE